MFLLLFFFFKQKTAYDMRISDWSSDVCSSDLYVRDQRRPRDVGMIWADKDLKPRRPSVESVLRAATFPEDFGSYLSAMGWMSEPSVRLRRLLEHAQKRGASEAALERIAIKDRKSVV